MSEALPAIAVWDESMAVWIEVASGGGATITGVRVAKPVGTETLEGMLMDVV